MSTDTKPETSAAPAAKVVEAAPSPTKKPADTTVGVVFSKSWKRWYASDRAGFSKEIAAQLVKSGVAHYAKSAIARAAAAVVEKLTPAAPPDTGETVAGELADMSKRDLVELAAMAGVEVDRSETVAALRATISSALVRRGVTVASVLGASDARP